MIESIPGQKKKLSMWPQAHQTGLNVQQDRRKLTPESSKACHPSEGESFPNHLVRSEYDEVALQRREHGDHTIAASKGKVLKVLKFGNGTKIRSLTEHKRWSEPTVALIVVYLYSYPP